MSQDNLDVEGKRPRRGFHGIRTRLIVSFSLLFVAVLVIVELIDIMGIPFIPYSGRQGQQRVEAFRSQVFSNLLDNALKYLDPKRAGIIKISGYKEKGKAVYCVEDNGIGIAKEHQAKIYEIFHRLNPNAGSGEGLGLTIIQKILDRHAGKIWVESIPGKGSKFFVSLPLN